MLNNIVALLDSGVAASTNSYESIATVTVGSGGSANITFSSIPGTYTHLQLRGITRTDRSADNNDVLAIQFNSDTGSNYSYHTIKGNGTSAGVDVGTSTSSIWYWLSASSASSANIFGAQVIDILDYANTNKYKTTRGLGGLDMNSATTNAMVVLNSGNWRSTSAISTIKIAPALGSNFLQYSTFALYGIKGA